MLIVTHQFTATLSEPLADSDGFAVVDVGLPGVVVESQGVRATTGWRGKATVPVRGFGRQLATIDTSTLPENSVLKENRVEVSTVPGQGAEGAVEVTAPGAFIRVKGAKPGSTVTVNGLPTKVYDFGAFAENLKMGKNEVQFAGRRYSFEIRKGDASLPVIELGGP